MSSGAVLPHDLVGSPELATRSRGLRLFCQCENLLLVVPLVAMLLLPVVEIVLRMVFKTGISGSSAIVQHLTLIVGMLGGAIAARDRRLLALSPVQTLLKGRARTAAQIFSSGFAAA
ncbi:MAG: TRAP transporter small permease subunit, partial [Verrucomicrobia bacterium]|nr:TRAP transporter small permease subunit [Verrucomicrobiota bacterium]